MKKDTFQKIFFVFLCLLVGGQFFYNSKVTQVIEEVEELSTTKTLKQEEYIQLKPYLNNRELLDDKIKKEATKLEELNQLIPNGEDTTKHIEYFYNLSKKHQVVGHQINFHKGQDENGFKTLTLDVAFEGKQPDLLQVVQDVQSFKEFAYSIEQMSINPLSENVYVLKLTLKTYYTEG